VVGFDDAEISAYRPASPPWPFRPEMGQLAAKILIENIREKAKSPAIHPGNETDRPRIDG
jgi:DNA-binding LacI/PurR family transcriptional regulator